MQKDLIATRSPGMPQGFGVGLAFLELEKPGEMCFLGPKLWDNISDAIISQQKKPSGILQEILDMQISF